MRRHITEFGHGGGQGAANGGGGNGGGLGLGRDEFHRFVAVTIGVPCAAREARALFDELLAKQQQQQQGNGGGGALTATAFYGAFFGQRDRSWEEAKPNSSQTPRQGASSPRAAPATMSIMANGLVVECDTGGLVGAAAAAAAEARAAAARHAVKRGVNDDSYTAEQARASARNEDVMSDGTNHNFASASRARETDGPKRSRLASRRVVPGLGSDEPSKRSLASRLIAPHNPPPLRARARAAVVGQALDVLRDHTKTKFKTVQARHLRALFELLFPHACSLVGDGVARFYR